MDTVAIPPVQRVPRFLGGGRIGEWNRPVPEPGPGELLVEVRANALCGTDRQQFEAGSAVTPGHEAAGIIAAAGPDTTTAPGTPGVIYLMDYCGACRSCRLGLTNQCLAKRADRGFTDDGGYGAYELVAETQFFPVDRDLPLADATLLLDVMGTSRHAIERALQIRGDVESVVVAGAGPVGLGVVVLARLLLGPNVPVVVGDVVPFRLDLAARLGGRPVDLRETSLVDTLRAAGLKDGADVAIDTAGRTTARVARARERGVQVIGYTWFPVFSHINWRWRGGRHEADHYWCHMGLWDLRSEGSAPARRVRTPLADRYAVYAAGGRPGP